MAEQIEIFRSMDDGSGDGVAIDKRQQGDAVAGANTHAILPAEDASNQLELLQIQDEGSAVPSKAQAMMPVKDDSGNLQYIPLIDGAIPVSFDNAGTKIGNHATGTVASPGVAEDAVVLTIQLNKNYNNVEVRCSSFKDCTWELQYVDDVGGTDTITVIDQFRTGAGSYTFSDILDNYKLVTNGGTGVQEFRLSVTQRSGSGSDYSASIRVVETP